MPLDLRVLIVEDIAAEAELAVRQLERSGIGCVHHRVDTRASFRQALQRVPPAPHPVGLHDSRLRRPGRARHRRSRSRPDVPFIFLSGTIGEERAIEALRRGAVDYVLKTNPARLAPAVRRALREVAERRRRRFAELRIRESEQRLRDIIDTAQDWIWELGAGGRYVFSSESVRGILGLRAGRAERHALQRLHPRGRQRRVLGHARRAWTRIGARPPASWRAGVTRTASTAGSKAICSR